MMVEKPFTLLALLLSAPGAYLAFKRAFIQDIRDQMIDLKNQGGVGTKTVKFSYRVFMFIFLGRRKNWLELFNPTSKEYEKAFKSDKTTALRVLVWFLLSYVFWILAWFFDK